MTKLTKKTLSVFLTVVMALSVFALAIPCLMPKAEAATAGSYTWRVCVHSDNDTGGWDDDMLTVYGKPANGTGSEVQIYSHEDWFIDFKGDRDNTFGDGNQTTSQFPTKLTYYYKFGGGIT